MHFAKPLWNPIWAGFCLRLPLGVYFILAGKYKYENLDAFIGTVKDYKLLVDQVATLYAVTVPFLEIAIGCLLLIGYWTTLAALIAVIVLASFTFVLGLKPYEAELLNKDVILLGAALALLSTGAGFFSVDNFRSKG